MLKRFLVVSFFLFSKKWVLVFFQDWLRLTVLTHRFLKWFEHWWSSLVSIALSDKNSISNSDRHLEDKNKTNCQANCPKTISGVPCSVISMLRPAPKRTRISRFAYFLALSDIWPPRSFSAVHKVSLDSSDTFWCSAMVISYFGLFFLPNKSNLDQIWFRVRHVLLSIRAGVSYSVSRK